ncbi:MAG: hypothetical protein RR238_09035 [Lachnospiraceae bacterium]
MIENDRNRKKGKQYLTMAVVMSQVLLITGCQNSTIPEMTAKQTELVSEYAANLMLTHNKNASTGIATQEEIAKEEAKQERQRKRDEAAANAAQKTEESNAAGTTGTTEASPTYVEMNQILGLEGTTITYQGYEVCSSYPSGEEESDYFALDAAEGKQLLVVKFALNATEEREINILEQYPLFRIAINGGNPKPILTTMLLNDLSTYKDTVLANTPVETVLVVEIPQEEAENISGITVTTKNGDAIGETLLQ